MIKWILVMNSILLYLCTVCEDVERPKTKEECFKRTFVGELDRKSVV